MLKTERNIEMDNTLIYVTGNSVKFDVALKAFAKTGINLLQMKLETPEILFIM